MDETKNVSLPQKPFFQTKEIPIGSSSNSLKGINQIEIPIIDYSMLRSDDPAQNSIAIDKLGRACHDYGFFIVINHGVPERLISRVVSGLFGFFDLEEEEKQKYQTTNQTDTIRWGKEYTREFFKVASHPHFHCPPNPPHLSEALEEYSKRLREVGTVLLRGISRALGLEELYIEKTMKLETGYDFFTANHYPPRLNNHNDDDDDDEKQIGQLPHYDPCLINLIMQDTNGGLQVEHKGHWSHINFKPNTIFAAVADHLEILTNGKYKSLLHKVTLNNEVRRVSLPLFIGPSLDAMVCPAPDLFDQLHHPPSYRAMTYKDYLEANHYHVIDGKSCLKQISL